LAGFLSLSSYAVIAGGALHYIVQMANGRFDGVTAVFAYDAFNGFLADPWKMVMWHTIFMTATIFIVARGVTKGLETAIRWFMPALLILLVVLLGYGVNSGGFEQGFAFMFSFNWESVTAESVLIAMGQAFFTLSLGMGAIMAYGAYMPSNASITSTVVIIALLDTFVALAAGLAIFPIVFANGLEPSQGPGLMFVTIPLAFGQMPLGALFGVIFFALVSFAAITSAISLTEPALAYLVEEYNAKRSRVAISVGIFCWVLGIGTVLSFNHWAEKYIVSDLTFFTFIDYVSQNIMLPLGGLLIALFAAYALPKTVVGSQLGLREGPLAVLWKVVIGVIAPLGVLTVFIATILGLG
ncbi:MAG: sodium-dependent transporter, partial [Gammaproteobacteria bacterium]|nr:sodium-dependent transporter [Gammaproteobacteria bacterium]